MADSGDPSMQFDALILSDMGLSLANQAGIEMSSNATSLNLTGRALQEDYQAILAEVFFQNTAPEPGHVSRRIHFFITDGVFSHTAYTTVEIISTNDPAFISIAALNITFNETSREPLNLFPSNVTISDDDGDYLEMVRIVIYPTVDEMDVLAADSAGTGLNITATTNSDGNIQLTISGRANFSAYAQVLQTVTFVNVFPGISLTERTLNVYTFDGMTESPAHQIFISIIDPFDDPPICFFGMLVRDSTYKVLLIRLFIPFINLFTGHNK